MKNRHRGSTLDKFLAEDDLLADVQAAAVKQALAIQVETAMRRAGLTKSEMAKRMCTSRAAVDRLLDPESTSVTLGTLARAASALGKTLSFRFA